MWLTPHSSLRRAFQHRFGVLADAAPLALLLASCIDGMGAILVLFGLTLLNNLLIEAPTQLLAIAVVVMAAALVGMLYVMPEWAQGTMPYRLMRLMAVVVVGVVAYFATLAVLGFKVKEFTRRTV